jgi:dolichol-phosphate mannosyltransferase
VDGLISAAASNMIAFVMPKIAVVVIPVYNEAASIGAMIEQLTERTFHETDWECSLLVVDGNSPDGTAEIVRAVQPSHPNVHLLVEEKKEGIGAAYFKGFKYAVRSLGAEVLIEFDGDFQHPPETIPLLLRAIDQGADLSLGSRKRPGGCYPKNWDPLRLFFSKVGGFVARMLLFFPHRSFWQVTDPTTGLKATRVNDKYRALDFSKFAYRGFAYKLEMLFRLVEQGAVIAEIPLPFQTREEGESKMTGQTPLEILGAAFRLRLGSESFTRFL